jgi:microsomal dipeptidase-like Zn-dependent dipeptidase
MNDWEQLHHRATVVDVHAHPALKATFFHRNLTQRLKVIPPFFWPLTVRTNFKALTDGGVDVLLSALYAPEKQLLDTFRFLKLLRFAPWSIAQHAWRDLFQPPYFTVTTTLLDDLEQRIAHYRQHPQPGQRPVELAPSVDDLDRMLAQGERGPIAFVHTVEGGHALEGATGSADEILRNLQSLFERGVASLTLAHFFPNRVVMPTFPYPEYILPIIPQQRIDRLWSQFDLTQGLTETGQTVVEAMLDWGMIIDLSHCTPTARQQIYAMAEQRGKTSAVIASHVGAYAIDPSPYNLEDWEIRWIAEHEGVIGVIFMNYWLVPYTVNLGINAISQTIEHMVKVVGGRTDHLALGTDFDGFTDPPDDLKSAADLPRLTQRLYSELKWHSQRRYTDGDIENILGHNALRVLRTGWGRQHA